MTDATGGSWGLWLRQVAAVARLELRRRLLGRRALGLYLIAVLPTVPLVLRAVLPFVKHETVAETISMYALYYNALLLRCVVFLGSMAIFVNLFRGDELERILHLYFLSPIRREVLAVAKFAAGVVLCGIPFSGTVLVSFAAAFGPHGLGAITERSGDLALYVGALWLAIVGYGAIGMLLGMLFRNAMLPALVFWIWEYANPVLPSLLKKFSILFWVQSLLPVSPSFGPFAVVAEPAPVWVAIPSVLVLAAALLALAALKIRHHEIRYAAD